jgi:hypothetical protein
MLTDRQGQGAGSGGWQKLIKGQGVTDSLPFSFTSEGGAAPLSIQQYKPASRISRILAYMEGREYMTQISRGRVPLAFAHTERQADGLYGLWTYAVLAQDIRPDTQQQVINLVNILGRLS